ncbi:hypothetical protein QE197_16815 [Arsenophonus nasoniae]|uniref:Uncharacterized protein n=1 Tax=Arsenophonus nasoniae TaxID=638 RepID=D2U1A6_9GAMM|nr:hypothetical protein [Arsenophonus nasoniae]QBY45223.1 hypothetical protein ArsFIN_38200 [Arsenophonus nasoniae]WGM01220.1 hypothetical protein QE210_15575 [Arsenophonus nasoniae]WGM05406.1 hypothetical protein QE258_18190 [Arsenophonus nasoniae]WGM10414.1 hypothetical protein QE197_16815 [Arsenophonus nasoniae]WGM15125.1 hypothetical protein QE193_16705 [Arsenophonus nasoniae]
MKLIEICEQETKQVNYFDVELVVNADINYLATDLDGFIYGYIFKPVIDDKHNTWQPSQEYTPHPIARITLDSKNWKDTLVNV